MHFQLFNEKASCLRVRDAGPTAVSPCKSRGIQEPRIKRLAQRHNRAAICGFEPGTCRSLIMRDHGLNLILSAIMDSSSNNTGWPQKKRTGYFPQYVDAITGITISVYELTSPWPENNDTKISNFGSVTLFSRAHFVRQCRGPNFSLFSLN